MLHTRVPVHTEVEEKQRRKEEKEIVDIECGSDVATSQSLSAAKKIWKRAGTDSLLQPPHRVFLSGDCFPAL